MKIGITIDGVVRDFITKFELVYDKYYAVMLALHVRPHA